MSRLVKKAFGAAAFAISHTAFLGVVWAERAHERAHHLRRGSCTILDNPAALEAVLIGSIISANIITVAMHGDFSQVYMSSGGDIIYPMKGNLFTEIMPHGIEAFVGSALIGSNGGGAIYAASQDIPYAYKRGAEMVTNVRGKLGAIAHRPDAGQKTVQELGRDGGPK